jgi:hypothetical protein
MTELEREELREDERRAQERARETAQLDAWFAQMAEDAKAERSDEKSG